MFFLEIHTEGATAPELAAYTGVSANAASAALHDREAKGLVYRTKPDSRTTLWHLSPAEAAQRLTPAPSRPHSPALARARTR